MASSILGYVKVSSKNRINVKIIDIIYSLFTLFGGFFRSLVEGSGVKYLHIPQFTSVIWNIKTFLSGVKCFLCFKQEWDLT